MTTWGHLSDTRDEPVRSTRMSTRESHSTGSLREQKVLDYQSRPEGDSTMPHAAAQKLSRWQKTSRNRLCAQFDTMLKLYSSVDISMIDNHVVNCSVPSS